MYFRDVDARTHHVMTKTPEHARNHLRKTNVEESISVPMQFTFILGEIISQSCTFKTKCLSRVVGAFCVPRKRVKNTIALHPGVEQLNRINATACRSGILVLKKHRQSNMAL